MIAFFGASVTLQKSGYAKVLKDKFDDNVAIFGYGGMHINNAGICFIDDVLEVKPIFCFIDFFSTVYTEQTDITKEYIDTIIYKFSTNGCKLIFLFFPKKDEPASWHLFCKQYLDERGMYYIDLNPKLSHLEKQTYLKDIVHTNAYGSQLYADIIYNEFKIIKDDLIIPENLEATNYTYIKKIDVEQSFDRDVTLKGSGRIIGILNTIGPFSGMIKLQADDKLSEVITIWDEWCYYTRKHFNISFSMGEKAHLTLLSDSFDTNSCKYPLNFEKYKKKIIIHTIYYTGEIIEISNFHNGKDICKWYLFFLNFKGRLFQLLSKQNHIKKEEK